MESGMQQHIRVHVGLLSCTMTATCTGSQLHMHHYSLASLYHSMFHVTCVYKLAVGGTIWVPQSVNQTWLMSLRPLPLLRAWRPDSFASGGSGNCHGMHPMPPLHLLWPSPPPSAPTPTYSCTIVHAYDQINAGSMLDPCGPGSHTRECWLCTLYVFVWSPLLAIGVFTVAQITLKSWLKSQHKSWCRSHQILGPNCDLRIWVVGPPEVQMHKCTNAHCPNPPSIDIKYKYVLHSKSKS